MPWSRRCLTASKSSTSNVTDMPSGETGQSGLLSIANALPLHVVIHGEFVRVRAEAQGVVFFLFHVDPVGDEVFVEDVAA
jgi:hypothetical protein